jgi:DnaK suppressor protein
MTRQIPAADIAAVLARKRAELDVELAVLSAPAEQAGEISFGKRVGDGTSVAVERLSQVAAYDRLQSLLSDVVRAEELLAEGGYGHCIVCGEAIADERLEALPWAVTCVACAGKR